MPGSEPKFEDQSADFEADCAKDSVNRLHIPLRCLSCTNVRIILGDYQASQQQKAYIEESIRQAADGIPPEAKERIRQNIISQGFTVDIDDYVAKMKTMGFQRAAFNLNYVDQQLEGMQRVVDQITSVCQGPLELKGNKNGVDHIFKDCGSAGDIPFPDAVEVTRIITAQNQNPQD